MRRSPPTGFSWASKLKLIESIGFLVAVSGFAIALACTWQMLEQGEAWAASPVPLYVGAVMLLTGIDLLVRPHARRLPSLQRIIDTVLRYRAGLAPDSSHDIESEPDAAEAPHLPNGVSNSADEEEPHQPGPSRTS